jgi:hypothetical protein
MLQPISPSMIDGGKNIRGVQIELQHNCSRDRLLGDGRRWTAGAVVEAVTPVIASDAKKSMPQRVEEWIASSLRSQ